MYSLMSMRIMACSSSKRNSASARAVSVLPTPVGPRKMNEPIGRFGSLKPARERRIALATTVSAASWPMTRSRSRFSISTSFFTSPSSIRETGIPVHLLTILAMSSSSTSSFNMRATPAFAVLRGVQLLQLRFQLGQLAVLNLRGAVELALARLLLGLEAQRLDLLLHLADAADGLALLGPARPQRRRSAPSARPLRAPLHCGARRCSQSVSRFSAARSISSEVASRSS